MGARVSRYTIVLTSIGLALTLGIYGAVRVLLSQGNDAAATAVSDIGGALVILTAGVVVLLTALRFQKGDAVRRHWMMIAVGTLVYALGDMTWTYFEVFRGTDPFPSLADAFYILSYVFLGIGIMGAALGYRQLVDLRKSAIVSAVVSVGLLGVLWWQLLGATFADPELDALSKGISIFYPVADVLFEFGPALLIVLIAWHLGRGRFGWPWWPLALGVALIAISDAGFALLDSKGLYEAGNIIDIGWMLGNVLIATGALVARDVFGVQLFAKPAAKQVAA